jgi:hypothetical protein
MNTSKILKDYIKIEGKTYLASPENHPFILRRDDMTLAQPHVLKELQLESVEAGE